MDFHLYLWMVLLLSTWYPTGHAVYSSPPEVVIPLRINGISRHDTSPDMLSYSLHIGGERHIITMKPTKYFISRNFLLLTYTEQGDLLAEEPFVQTDCYYHGNVDGDPDSMVIINTCLGSLQGMLEINGTAYEIMPKKSTSTFEHLAYKMDSEDSESFSIRCGLTEAEIARQIKIQESKDPILMQSQYENWWTHHKYLEYYVVIDNQRYVYRASNVTVCMQEMLQIVNGINGYYRQIDVEVILTTLEVWTQTNHVNVTESIYSVLPNFCHWKSRNIDRRVRNDLAHLYARQGYGYTLGLAYVGTICEKYGCAVNSYMTNSISEIAFIVAHEMGHNLGMSHDEKYCTCGRDSCIMAAHKSNSPKFSNCSYGYLFGKVTIKPCLHNYPDTVVRMNATLPGPALCGNNIVEDGEQCDCGSPQLCVNNPCCTEDCVFKTGAECASGFCCKDCKFIPTGTVCREKKNDCDLPEWCNGTSPECPEDMYVADGSQCRGDGYCYNMACHKLEEHCWRLFGNTSKSAKEICYKEMNKRGDRFGNCGNDSFNYRRCADADVLCGRIQCDNVQQIPNRSSHETVLWTHFKHDTCWSIDFHFGMTIEDSGAVRDGTPCGQGKICIKRKCVPHSTLISNCTVYFCNMNGVCNNKHHCHCDAKWEPPDCNLTGFGGSIDSGPPPRIYPRKPLGGMFILAFLILFLALLFSLIFLITKVKSHHKLEVEETPGPGPGPEPEPRPGPESKPKPEPKDRPGSKHGHGGSKIKKQKKK
ncbi:disintegrin and metalloproteinase domain-containing protein 26A-like [Mesocricetus auratus]|uniref:Disintegrin and metalloproteinase domain-containing protein 26A-like n=1 Tax=Mesocricetus auratus TaxID=10036 RepID=A0ABM2WAK2_MESAU|nr:disintegrin and metalloproteinase domain-containing protein 26A-like [Mesocricetus auratus]